MIRRIWLFPVLLLMILGAVVYSATCANETEEPATTPSPDSAVTIQKLLDRIESLEKRITKLETGETLVRVADRREEQAIDNPSQMPWQPKAANPDREERTNGQKWQFKLLNHKN